MQEVEAPGAISFRRLRGNPKWAQQSPFARHLNRSRTLAFLKSWRPIFQLFSLGKMPKALRSLPLQLPSRNPAGAICSLLPFPYHEIVHSRNDKQQQNEKYAKY